MTGPFSEQALAALGVREGLEGGRRRGAVDITGGPTVIATFTVPAGSVALVTQFSGSLVAAAATMAFELTLRLDGVVEDDFVLSGTGTTVHQKLQIPFVPAAAATVITVEGEKIAGGVSVVTHAGFSFFLASTVQE